MLRHASHGRVRHVARGLKSGMLHERWDRPPRRQPRSASGLKGGPRPLLLNDAGCGGTSSFADFLPFSTVGGFHLGAMAATFAGEDREVGRKGWPRS